jgi:hypothetical protein
MSGSVYELEGIRVFECASEGPELLTARDATDLMSEAWSQGAQFIAVPVQRLGDAFFELRTRIAGELAQKFVTYGARVAILGDISERLAQSQSLSAFVLEANRGKNLWFVADRQELAARFAAENLRPDRSR